MMPSRLNPVLLLILALILAPSLTQVAAAQVLDPAAAQAGPYDNGKMWLFEYPPTDYLEETYGFRPDADWFERARLSALRLPGCSGAFVSASGLVVTNHHCVRSRVSAVSGPDERLLERGFYAETQADERPIPGYYADQLVAIEDVTDEVYGMLDDAQTPAEREAARAEAFATVQARIMAAYPEDDVQVQVISLYSGGRYSAYVFKRYNDVRLVMAVELALGFFGGEPDNFTYPRYALDYAFLRIYGEDGMPVESPNYFAMSQDGVAEEDLVFVIGNPGSTSRLLTMAQFEYLRDVQVPHTLRFLNNRLEVLRDLYEQEKDVDPVKAEGIRNTIFSLSNSQKAYSGRYAALNDPVIMARRADAEQQFRDAIATDESLEAIYGAVFDEIDEINEEKQILGDAYGAFRLIQNGSLSAAITQRMFHAFAYLRLLEQGAAPDSEPVLQARADLLAVPDKDAAMERGYLTQRFEEFLVHLGPTDRITQVVLQGATPAEAAARMLETSVLRSQEAAGEALGAGMITRQDPMLQLAAAMMPRYQDFESASAGLGQQEGELSATLGRARFEVYGTQVPPDATFSPRITDGTVKGYAYNGTQAPPYTTFYGLYDHAYSYPSSNEWTLPERWQTPHSDLNMGTPLNFVSTADTIGGNSGSPVVTPELELVGLNFDRNIEGLSRDYIYLPEQGRHISVDVRAIQESLRVMYGGDRLLRELRGE